MFTMKSKVSGSIGNVSPRDFTVTLLVALLVPDIQLKKCQRVRNFCDFGREALGEVH